MNYNNLKTLADYLINGKFPAKFDMDRYCQPGFHFKEICGSVGCAVGFGPFSGISKKTYESWGEYSERVFEMPIFDNEWEWCFGSNWSSIDNTPRGAGLRILYLLDNGLPENWFKQMIGSAKLCYVET